MNDWIDNKQINEWIDYKQKMNDYIDKQMNEWLDWQTNESMNQSREA